MPKVSIFIEDFQLKDIQEAAEYYKEPINDTYVRMVDVFLDWAGRVKYERENGLSKKQVRELNKISKKAYKKTKKLENDTKNESSAEIVQFPSAQ